MILCFARTILGVRAGEPGTSLRLLYTGNLRGVLEPCGCQPFQPGGLSRRAALLRTLRPKETPSLLVDDGDNVPPVGATAEMLAFVYRTLRQLRYDVANAGPFGHYTG
jgi:2',3'-cyclic-nucleotide 2'-phosphodiesterase (5'-nucleotidase family)